MAKYLYKYSRLYLWDRGCMTPRSVSRVLPLCVYVVCVDVCIYVLMLGDFLVGVSPSIQLPHPLSWDHRPLSSFTQGKRVNESID